MLSGASSSSASFRLEGGCPALPASSRPLFLSIGSALGLARRTLSTRPFHCMPCTIFMALSLSSSFLKVTKANICFPNSLILCGLRRCFSRNFFKSLKPMNLGRFWISTLKISEVKRSAWT
uniref:Uncharacterized protein n=1 Tax=Oncorhynchus tshawytscha TaxID=74940 RepID=A0AAZ3RZB1_ONCTS